MEGKDTFKSGMRSGTTTDTEETEIIMGEFSMQIDGNEFQNVYNG